MVLAMYNNCIWLVLLCWLLTGVGGGTVFCIRHLSNKYEYINMNLSENIGHILGSIFAIFISYCYVENEITYLFFAAFIFVIVAIGIAIGIQ